VKQLHQLASLAGTTLALQKEAWCKTRRADDNNFDWWFTDPLNFQRDCLTDLAGELTEIAASGKAWSTDHADYLRLRINKGIAPSWNLLRLRIYFSCDAQTWSQVFFRTVPLWMDNGVTINLMPRGPLPRHIRIETSAWTWHPGGDDWSDMLRWEVDRLRGVGRIQNNADVPGYRLVASSANDIHLMLCPFLESDNDASSRCICEKQRC